MTSDTPFLDSTHTFIALCEGEDLGEHPSWISPPPNGGTVLVLRIKWQIFRELKRVSLSMAKCTPNVLHLYLHSSRM